MVGWLDQYLRSPDGLYWDHITVDGGIDEAIFAYNQGVMIGAGLMLERMTGDRAWVDRALRTADAMLALYAAEGMASQVPHFSALFARYLLMAWAYTGEPRYRRFVESFAAWAWDNYRDPRTELYRFEPQGMVGEVEQTILWQAGMAQVNALLTLTPLQLKLLV
jgi:predicted alpha-1,6-mannanase (GH76 family)